MSRFVTKYIECCNSYYKNVNVQSAAFCIGFFGSYAYNSTKKTNDIVSSCVYGCAATLTFPFFPVIIPSLIIGKKLGELN